MAKGSGKGGGGLLIFLIIVGTFMWILFSNLFNFPAIVNFGPMQYAVNIKNFHSDYYCAAKTTLPIHEKLIAVAQAEKAKPPNVLRPGERFTLKGYRRTGSVTWVAVETYNKNQVIHGYVLIPNVLNISTFRTTVPLSEEDHISNAFFGTVSSETVAAFWDRLEQKAKGIINSKFDVKIAQGEIQVQKIRESDSYTVINQFSSVDRVYYSSKAEYSKIDHTLQAYIGDNFETNFLQISEKYEPLKDGVYKQTFMLSLLENWYFKLASPFLVLIALPIFFTFLQFLFTPSHKCSECGSKDYDITGKSLVGESYKYETKEKERDRRYNDNPLIQRISIRYRCNECAHAWSEQKTEESNKKKGQTKFRSYEKPKAAKPKAIKPKETKPKAVASVQAQPLDARTKMLKLKKLYEAGKIDQSQYANMKNKILNCI